MPWHSMCTRRRMLSHEVISCAGGAGDWQQPAAPMSCPRAVAARAVATTCRSGSQGCGPPTAAHRATTPAAGLLQMAIWDEMKEYGVDQNTISYSSLLSRWQLARHREVRLRKQQGERGPRRRNARRRVATLRGGALQPRRVRPARAGSAGATAPDVTAASLQRLMYGCLAVRDHVLLRVILFGTYHHHLSPLGGARGR